MAQSKRLTLAEIERKVPVAAEVWLSDDDGTRGTGRLALRITSKGNRRFYFRFFSQGKRILLPLGNFARTPRPGCLTLDQARKVARMYSIRFCENQQADLEKELLERLRAPASNRPAQGMVAPLPKKPDEISKPTLIELCRWYVDHLKRRNAQSVPNYLNIIKRHIEPTPYAHIAAVEVSTDQIMEILQPVADADHLSTTKRIRQLLLAAYNLAISSSKDVAVRSELRRFQLQSNPVEGTKPVRASNARERAPATRLELGHMWLYLCRPEFDLSVVTHALKLNFLLGGQRCLQLLRCKLSDVDLDSNTLLLQDPKGRRRTPRMHLLPLTASARAEVMVLRQFALDLGNSYLIPGLKQGQPLTEGPLSRFVPKMSSRLIAEKKLGSKFLYANIRSTIKTRMGELEVPQEIKSEIQSHGLGGVEKFHYDRWAYIPQKLRALQTWERYLLDAAEFARTSHD